MDKLLKWSVDAANGVDNGPPDPQLLAKLFGGADDGTMMKENLKAAVESKDLNQRIECLEAFEDLIENIDNANDMGALWEPLIYLVNDKEPQIRLLALSAIGSAVQNNDKAQADLVKTKVGIPTILARTNDDNDAVANKALYALSCALAHCLPAYEQFEEAKGWETFKRVFDTHFDTNSDHDVEKLQSRVLSVLNALVLNAPHKPVFAKLDSYGMVDELLRLQKHDGPISNLSEKIDHILSTLREEGYLKK